MRHSNDNSFAERRKTAESAKRQLIARFSSAPKPADPEMRERLASREAIALARAARRAERDAVKTAENNRLLLEASAALHAAEQSQRAEVEARQAEVNNRVARTIADEAARKAERDRRYAARKARRG